MSLDDEVNIFMKNIVKVIINLCQKKKITKEELARKIQISDDELDNILFKNNKELQIKTLIHISVALEIPINILLDIAQQRTRREIKRKIIY